MLQKILKIGNSLGVTLPQDFVSKYKIEPGSKIERVQNNGSITYSTRLPRTTKYEAISDSEFLSCIKEVESRYKNALDELANLE